MSKDAYSQLSIKQCKFVDNICLGKTMAESYAAAGYVSKYPRESGVRLAGRKNVKQAILDRKSEMKEKVDFTRIDMAKYWISILKTPVGDVDQGHKLCQEYNYTATEEVEKVQVKMPSKTEAGKALTALMGWNEPEKVDVSVSDPIVQLLKDIRNG